MKFEDLARAFARYYPETADYKDSDTGFFVVFYHELYNYAEFRGTRISDYDLKKGKTAVFNQLTHVLDYTKYSGFIIFDKDYNDVTDEWDRANDSTI